MVRKGPVGYLGLCFVVILYFFANSRRLGSAPKREITYDTRASSSNKPESSFNNDKGNDLSQYKEQHTTALNSTGYTNTASSSHNANNRNLSEKEEYSAALNSSEYTNTSSSSHHANNQSLSEITENATALNSSEYSNTMARWHDLAINQNLSGSNIYYINGTYAVLNPWYGWQPEIHPMDCSWDQCMMENHKCKFCRDAPEDLNVTNSSSSLDPGPDWIPDVTMLRRMFLDGHDANGNPWPPPLGDDLCWARNKSRTKELLDVVPIMGAPLPRTPETTNNKILCMIYTKEDRHATTIRAMRETWAAGCDGFLAFSTKTDPRIPAIRLKKLYAEKYRNMWQKVRSMDRFVGKHYINQFDWFYIGGDDLVAFPQKLKDYLAKFDSSKPNYIGRRFKDDKVGFNTGGAGYALSRPAYQCLVDHLDDKRCNPLKKTSQEDTMTALCLRKACKIHYTDTRDEELRERFHHFSASFEYRYKGRLNWYKGYNREWGPVLLGKNCCSPETVNFHYMKNPASLRYVYHYVHNCNRTI